MMKKYILISSLLVLTACNQETPEPPKVDVNMANGGNALKQVPISEQLPAIPEINDANCKFENLKSITDIPHAVTPADFSNSWNFGFKSVFTG
jgi:hypothetical protein